MSDALLGLLMIAAGGALAVAALLADFIGVGSDVHTFGWFQILLLLLGLAIAVGGWFLYRRE